MSTEAFFTLNVAAWPNVRIDFHKIHGPNKEHVTQLIDSLSSLFDRKEAFSILFDTRQMNVPPLAFVKDLARWMEARKEDARAYILRSAILTKGKTVSLFLKVLFKIRKPTSPMVVSTNLADCCKFLGWFDRACAFQSSTTPSVSSSPEEKEK